jgi:HD-GYP domain-containing protein (c-di-GMP phosphodiesterase class II)
VLSTTVVATSLAGIAAFFLASITSSIDTWHMSMAANASSLAIAASLLTAVALYPVLRTRERWLMRAVSTITHDNIEFLSVLGKLTELRNGETAGHNLRVTLYTLMFAEALQLSPREIVRAVKGAVLHDVGKLAVPDSVLGKPGPLTPDERLEMNKHVCYGLEIISQSIILQEAAPVVGGHHERYDGQGYPIGLKSEAIPREARLFALVDVFDALTSWRVYKPALDIQEALSTMAVGRGSHFDPVLFDRFVDLVPGFARRMPQDQTALTMLLMDRLLPYFELLVLGRERPTSSSVGQVSWVNQVFQGLTAKTTQPIPAVGVNP